MPRPQVKPQYRQRALQACVPCKMSKKRCDSKQPCQNCSKRNDGTECTYSNPEKPRIPGIKSNVLSKKKKQVKTGTSSPNVGIRMLWTSRGNQVYIGGSGSLSFLHLLRELLKRYMGPSAFTNDTRRIYMLETQRDEPVAPESLASPYGVSQFTELVDHFFAATSGVMDVLERQQVLHYLHQNGQINGSTYRDALIHVMVAIGAQCRMNGPMDQQCEKTHIAKAQGIAFTNMLEDPSVDMVRLFLTLSFYMLGACRRNAAFMYIGVAARAAYVLGLHHDESYRSVPEDEKRSCLTTWKSVRILDLLVSAILGRPAATSEIETAPKPETEEEPTNDTHRSLCFEATFGIWSIVDQIVQKFYRQNDADTSSASDFLTRVQDWSSNVSPSLKKPNSHTESALHRQERAIGNLHVACSYYYAVILVTRKYLISYLATQLESSADDEPNKTDQRDSYKDSAERSKLAQTCIESAILTLQTCREVSEASMLLKNMCLLKAWIFGAALVLGFAMFTRESPDPEMEAAYNGGNEVLSMLAVHSPQAKLYFDILSNLHDAIKYYHQQKVSAKKGQSRNSFVEKMFDINDFKRDTLDSSPGEMSSLPTINSESPLDMTNPGWLDFSDPSNYGNIDFGNEMNMTFDGMDSVAVQLWDDFLLGQDMSSNALAWPDIAPPLGSTV